MIDLYFQYLQPGGPYSEYGGQYHDNPYADRAIGAAGHYVGQQLQTYIPQQYNPAVRSALNASAVAYSNYRSRQNRAQSDRTLARTSAVPATQVDAEVIDGQFADVEFEPRSSALQFHYKVTFDLTDTKDSRRSNAISWFSNVGLTPHTCSQLKDFARVFKKSAHREGSPLKHSVVRLEFELDEAVKGGRILDRIEDRIVCLLQVMQPTQILLEARHDPRYLEHCQKRGPQNSRRPGFETMFNMVSAHKIAAICYEEALNNLDKDIDLDVQVLPLTEHGGVISYQLTGR